MAHPFCRRTVSLNLTPYQYSQLHRFVNGVRQFRTRLDLLTTQPDRGHDARRNQQSTSFSFLWHSQSVGEQKTNSQSFSKSR